MYNDEYYDYDYGYEDSYDDANEEALDMALDMSDRYGISLEEAYDFTCYALESRNLTADQRYDRRVARQNIAKSAEDALNNEYDRKIGKYQEALRQRSGRNKYSNYTKARNYVQRPDDRVTGTNALDRARTDAGRAALNAYMYPTQRNSAPYRKFANSK